MFIFSNAVQLGLGNGDVKAKYVYANGKHIAKIDGIDKYFYHLDPVGSPLVITKAGLFGAEIAKQYKYYAFGDLRYESGSLPNSFKFAGKELDGSGLYYFGARYYDKSLGRWIAPDPKSSPSDLNLNDPQTLNPYVYCTNNPLKYLDPNGLERYVIRRNHDVYAYRQGTGMAIGEFGFTTFLPGGGLLITGDRALHGDYTVNSLDWAFAVGGIVSPVGKMIKNAFEGTNAIRNATAIAEARIDKTIMGIYAEYSGNVAQDAYGPGLDPNYPGAIYSYYVGNMLTDIPLNEKYRISNLPNAKDIDLIKKFWKVFVGAGKNWENVGDKESYKEYYNAYLRYINKQN